MRTFVGALAGLTLGCALTWGLTASPQTPESDQVAVFNDGWADSKQDDCNEGSDYACAWIVRYYDIPTGE